VSGWGLGGVRYIAKIIGNTGIRITSKAPFQPAYIEIFAKKRYFKQSFNILQQTK